MRLNYLVIYLIFCLEEGTETLEPIPVDFPVHDFQIGKTYIGCLGDWRL